MEIKPPAAGVQPGLAFDTSPKPGKPAYVSLFLPSLVGGGAERVFLTLAEGFINRGIRVDLIAAGGYGELIHDIDPRARLVDFGKTRIISALPAMIRYLRTQNPQVLISALTHTNLVAIWAKKLAGSRTRLILTEHLSMQVRANLKHRMLYPLAGLFYPSADAIIAVSDGVAKDFRRLMHSKTEVNVIYNPVNLERIMQLSQHAPEHPWLVKKECPVFVAVGRLHPNKDYPTMLQAFARIHAQLPSKLIILGKGSERSRLEALIASHGLSDSVSMPGFVDNPYPYMRNADVFLMSSVFEGLMIVLIEALACGATIVATDCPSGPAEVLAGGEFGTLVPVGRPDLLAQAVMDACNEPIEKQKAIERAAWFDVNKITDHYLELIQNVLARKGT